MKYLTIITSRKGSKRLPNKNILEFNNRPLIEWTFSAAFKTPVNQTIVVSTDCVLIQELALKRGFECRSLRPSELASDSATSVQVVEYELQLARERGLSFDAIILLQPTSPLRTFEHIRGAIDLFETSGCDSVQSYSKSECPPHWLYKISDDLEIIDLNAKNVNSQQAGDYYRANGAVYVIKESVFSALKTFTPLKSKAYLMPRHCSIDIDDKFDFAIAEFLSKNLDSIF